MIGSWSMLVPEMIQHPPKTRKKRLKFRKRWRKQHGGQNFTWWVAYNTYGFKPIIRHGEIIAFRRPAFTFPP